MPPEKSAQELWTAVDQYLTDKLVGRDEALDAALAANAAAGLPAISVAANEGKFLHMLVRIQGARKILEIGTLGGYSTIWLARAMPPGGRLITLEADPKHAEVARKNIANAKLSAVVDLRLGRAIETLPKLQAEAANPFDFVFIDADKQSNADYFQWALKLSRPGTIIVIDNVIRDGTVVDANTSDPSIQGVRRLNDVMAAEPRVTVTALQTVGSKGYDGMALALVNS